MSLISYSTITDGTTASASQVNTPLTTIYNDYNGNITDANIASAAAIAFSKISGGSAAALTAGTTWVPTWAGITIGNGVTTTAKYIQIGKLVYFRIVFTCGSTTVLASGVDTTFTLPVTAASGYNTAASPIGTFWYNHVGTNVYHGHVNFNSTTQAVMYLDIVSSTAIVAKAFNSANASAAFANNDIVAVEGVYEAA